MTLNALIGLRLRLVKFDDDDDGDGDGDDEQKVYTRTVLLSPEEELRYWCTLSLSSALDGGGC